MRDFMALTHCCPHSLNTKSISQVKVGDFTMLFLLLRKLLPLGKVRYLSSTVSRCFHLLFSRVFAFHCFFYVNTESNNSSHSNAVGPAIINEDLLQYSQHREFYYQISETEKKNLFIGVSPVPFSNVSTHLFIFCSSSLSLRQFSKGVYFACVRNEGEGLEETQSDREKEGGEERERGGDVRA